MLERFWGKGNTSALLVGMQAGTATSNFSMAISQKIRKKATSRPSNNSFGYIPKGCSSYQKDMCSTMFITALFVTARTWKQPKCPQTKEWIKKIWYIYTMEYYTAKKNYILKFAGKWIDLENIILTEVAQTQKDKYHMYSLIHGIQT